MSEMQYNYAGSTDEDTTTGGADDDAEQVNLSMEPYTYISFIPEKVFGFEYSNGDQTLAFTGEKAQLHDGALYRDTDDPDGEKHKLFSWPSIMGRGPNEMDISPDDPQRFLQKTYGSTDKEYEFSTARVGPDENPEEPIALGDLIMWHGTSDDKPKSVSKTLAQLLTKQGTDIIVDDTTTDNWLAETDPSDNLLREDLKGRRLLLTIEKKQSNQSERKYHHPVLRDLETGEKIMVQSGDGGGASRSEEESIEDESGDSGLSETKPSERPEAVQDYLNAARSVCDTREDAEELLDDIISDTDMDLTEADVSEAGGREEIMAAIDFS